MGAVRPFCEAGTRPSEPGASLDAAGIPFLPALKSGSPSARGGGCQFSSLWALGSVFNHINNFLPLLDAAVAPPVNGRKMCEDLGAAFIRSNKANPLLGVEPLNLTLLNHAQIMSMELSQHLERACNSSSSYQIVFIKIVTWAHAIAA
jgi:hypothetical protein